MLQEKEATAGLVYIPRGNLVLGVSRRDDHSAFGLIGGKCDPNEPARAAAARELFEETTLIAPPESLKLLYVGLLKKYTIAVYEASVYYGTPTTTAEGVVKWCTWEELFAGPFGQFNRDFKKALDTLEDKEKTKP